MNDAAKMYVMDLTALPGHPPREHEMVVDGITRPFKFHAGKPLELPTEIAVKFLKHSTTFKLTDKLGNVQEWRGAPKQPEDLQAGERLRLGPDETVARYAELTDDALFVRVCQMPGGEAVARSSDRAAIITFIMDATAARKKANSVSEADPDSFIPEPEFEDAA